MASARRRCSVPHQASALAELHRMLRHRGELRFYEHVIARCQPKRAILQLADRSGLWPAIAGGCQPARDTSAAIEAAGFTIEHPERFGFSASAVEPSVPHILGVARRPCDALALQPASRPRAKPEPLL